MKEFVLYIPNAGDAKALEQKPRLQQMLQT